MSLEHDPEWEDDPRIRGVPSGGSEFGVLGCATLLIIVISIIALYKKKETMTPVTTTTQQATPGINIESLSADQLSNLQKQLEQKKAKEKQDRADSIEAYKGLVDDAVKVIAPDLADFGTEQNIKVQEAFSAFEKALELKKEIYGFKDDQASHTFTARDGSASVTIGYNEIVGFDGTESAGVQKIREFITTLTADDENRKVLASLLETFMKPNKKGELNPTRVAELVAQKDKIKDEGFHEGVDIIVNAQFKNRTTTYVKGWFKRKDGQQEMKLEFRISTN